MAYHLLNTETRDYYYCDDHDWINAIETAIENGWDPDGTFFDFFFIADDDCFDVEDGMYYFFRLILAKNESLVWDGSYFEKRNQVVMYEDSIYLASALEGSGVSAELLDFIKKGSFRICSE